MEVIEEEEETPSGRKEGSCVWGGGVESENITVQGALVKSL